MSQNRAMREGRWPTPEMRETCFQITGKTVGLVGFGNIGRMLEQVVVTPHAGGGVLDNVANVARHALGNITRFLRGEPIASTDVVIPAPLSRQARTLSHV